MTTCSTCGGTLRPDASCPVCLLASDDGMATATLPSTREPPPLEELRRRLPDFEILALHGRGGMGAVYRARQRGLAREVALKIVVPDRPEAAARFAVEARALSLLSHPGIVAVHAVGSDGDLCWLAMEFVDGPTLRAAMRSGALSPERALALIPTLCDALQYAHDRGVVHRDIKPENLLVDAGGRLKIADFGLARLLAGGRPSPAATRDVMGTPSYMAPEQIERPTAVDHRADLYALGVVVYELLTGELPLGRFPPPSRTLAVDVRFDEVVLRALEKEPERRWQRAGEFGQRVGGIVDSPRPARTASRSEDFRTRRTWRGWPLRYVMPFAIACLLLVVCGALLGSPSVLRPQPAAAEPPARSEDLLATAEVLATALSQRRWDDVRAPFDDGMRRTCTAGVLESTWDEALRSSGSFVAWDAPVAIADAAGFRRVQVPARFADRRASLTAVFTADGAVTGLWLRPLPLGDAVAVARAREVAAWLVAEDFVRVEEAEAPEVRAALAAGRLAEVWHSLARDRPVVPGEPGPARAVDGFVAVAVPLTVAEERWELTVSTDDRGRIVGVLLSPEVPER